jgi:hypothetical protein
MLHLYTSGAVKGADGRQKRPAAAPSGPYRSDHPQHQNATPLQRAVDRVTALVGRPRFLGVLTVIVASWISLNLLAGALYVVGLILATQRRESLTTSASSSTWSWRC